MNGYTESNITALQSIISFTVLCGNEYPTHFKISKASTKELKDAVPEEFIENYNLDCYHVEFFGSNDDECVMELWIGSEEELHTSKSKKLPILVLEAICNVN